MYSSAVGGHRRSYVKKRLIRRPEVQRRTSLSRAAIYAQAALGLFPRPIKLTVRASAWDEAEVDAWIAARLEGREWTPSLEIEAAS
jgi:prophage regulatory protein